MIRLSFLSVFWAVVTGISAVDSTCMFTGLVAKCSVDVGGIWLDVSARINHCSTPIDVTFHIERSLDAETLLDGQRVFRKPERKPIYWDYTFVTTNNAETRAVPWFGRREQQDGQRVLLHITSSTTTIQPSNRSAVEHQSTVEIKAQFIIDGQTDDDLEVLRDQVRIAHFDDCANHRAKVEVNLIAVSTIVVVAILGALSLVGLCVYKHRHSAEDRLNLVNNMHQQSPARPYNLTTPEERGEFHQRQPSIHLDMVRYVVPAKFSDVETSPGANKRTAEDDRREEANELKVYVSTSNGLKRVVEPSNAAGSRRSNESPSRGTQKGKSVQFSKQSAGKDKGHDSVDDEELPPPPLPRKPQIQDPLSSNSRPSSAKPFIKHNRSPTGKTSMCSSSSSDSASSRSTTSSGKYLGAIPKHRGNGKAPNTKVNRSSRNSTQNNGDVKCRQSLDSSSSPLSTASSGTSISR